MEPPAGRRPARPMSAPTARPGVRKTRESVSEKPGGKSFGLSHASEQRRARLAAQHGATTCRKAPPGPDSSFEAWVAAQNAENSSPDDSKQNVETKRGIRTKLSIRDDSQADHILQTESGRETMKQIAQKTSPWKMDRQRRATELRNAGVDSTGMASLTISQRMANLGPKTDLPPTRKKRVTIHRQYCTGHDDTTSILADIKSRIHARMRFVLLTPPEDRQEIDQIMGDDLSLTHAFLETNLLSTKQQRVRLLARQANVNANVADDVRSLFDKFDADGSGYIDESEFRELLGELLQVTDAKDIPQNRFEHFWRQLDHDYSGEISFEELFAWYLKSFPPEHQFGTSAQATDPMRQFYSRIGSEFKHHHVQNTLEQ